MPLHLLPKKSWNVYNTANVERVRKDEAEAAAREVGEEQRLQEEDAERRIRLLRGEAVSPPPEKVASNEDHIGEKGKRKHDDGGRDTGPGKKRKRIHGEDDTERELRYAREDMSKGSGDGKELRLRNEKTSDAPLVDRRGHIDLFPMEKMAVEKGRGGKGGNGKHPEIEKEKKRKERELEDQYTMRFSNAAGFRKGVKEKAWYENLGSRNGDGGGAGGEEEVGRDVWGNEDPRRKEREKARVVKDDPLAMIQRGVKGVREVEREKKRWREEKVREIKALEEEERRDKRRRRSEREERKEKEGQRSGERHHRDRRRSRSRSREHRRHSHHQ